MRKLPDNTIPSYRLHRQSGQAIVTLCGLDKFTTPTTETMTFTLLAGKVVSKKLFGVVK